MTYQLVGIHGTPRSGTTWLGQLLNSQEHVVYRYQPFFSYAFRDRIDERSEIDEIRAFTDDLIATDDEFVNQSGTARLSESAPEFTKLAPTHLVYKEVRFHHLIEHILTTLPDSRFIGIVRDPRAVLASWFNAPREFNPDWSQSEEWRQARLKNAGLDENWYGYDRWKQLASLFLEHEEHHPTRFRLVRYEDLVADPHGVVHSLFLFCGLHFTAQTRRFIEESTTRDDGDPYGVFRRHGASTPILLPADVVQEIERDLDGTALARFLSV